MIEIKEAVSKSYETLKDLALVPETAGVELEEAELAEDGTIWVITLSYPEPPRNSVLADVGPNLRAMLSDRRAYKAVRVQASDGSIRGIKSIHA
jgi:hypothetical protein